MIIVATHISAVNIAATHILRSLSFVFFLFSSIMAASIFYLLIFYYRTEYISSVRIRTKYNTRLAFFVKSELDSGGCSRHFGGHSNRTHPLWQIWYYSSKRAMCLRQYQQKNSHQQRWEFAYRIYQDTATPSSTGVSPGITAGALISASPFNSSVGTTVTPSPSISGTSILVISSPGL